MTLTLQQAASLVGRRIAWNVTPQVKMNVIVLNARQEYGRTRFNVQPVSGKGSQWVDETSLDIGDVGKENKHV